MLQSFPSCAITAVFALLNSSKYVRVNCISFEVPMQCWHDKGVEGSNLDKTVVTRKCNVDAGNDGPVDGIIDGNAVDEQDTDGDAELESNQGLSLSCG